MDERDNFASRTLCFILPAPINALRRKCDLAQILPIPKIMARPNSNMSALIEILDLCAETLTSLNAERQRSKSKKNVKQAGQTWKSGPERSAPRLLLLAGGLAHRKPRDSSR
ncbi:MAG TPA: hypothetical protein VGD38_17170 [Pyrinomonadaceae bacterium]